MGQAMEMDGGARCRVELVRPGLPADYKYMSNRVAERVAFLEARMLSFCAALEAATGCPAGNPVGLPTQVRPMALNNNRTHTCQVQETRQGREKALPVSHYDSDFLS